MSFSVPQRQRSAPVLPLAALVDVLFLLLVFFVAMSLMREPSLYVEAMPPAVGTGMTGGGADVVITVDPQNRIMFRDREYELPELQRMFAQLHRDFPDEPIVVRGDRGASHGQVMAVKDAAWQAGFSMVMDSVLPHVE